MPPRSARLLAPLLGSLLGACGAPGGGGESRPVPAAAGPRAALQAAMVVERSERMAPGDYLRPDPSGEGVIRIQGRRGVELDLRGVRLRGQDLDDPLEAAQGVGLLIEDCDGVSVRGGELGGFLAGVLIRNCTDVTIEGMTFDGYRAQRLRGTATASDPADLLDPLTVSSGDRLEQYGAAILVLDSNGVTVRECRARRGQNGILLLRSEGCEIYRNDFSFLSGWGVALVRSSGNRVSHNRLDYIARGHAPGGPGEGYNGAGIVLSDRSASNTFAWNSATRCGYGALIHGGAARGAERSGSEGGCDDNLFYRNDFSHALAQGLLAVESRGGWVVGCEFAGTLGGGLRAVGCTGWVVYASELRDVPGAGISLEGSRECLIIGNTLRECDRAFQARPLDAAPGGAPGDPAAPRSSGHWLVDNSFRENLQDLVLESTRGLVASGNRYASPRRDVHLSGLEGEGQTGLTSAQVWGWLAGPDGVRPSGRAWRSSLRRAEGEQHPSLREVLRFEPPRVPGSPLAAAPSHPPGLQGLWIGSHGPWDFAGPTPRPPAAAPGGLLAGVTWDATWFRFGSSSDPRGDLEAWRALAFEPLHRTRVERWVDPWGGQPVRDLIGARNFGLIATARVLVPESGTYRLSILSDDGVRLLVDGDVVYEDWTWHPARRDSAMFELKAGRRELRLEYFQLDGAAALALDLERVLPAGDLPQARSSRPMSEPRPSAAEATSPP